DKSPPPSRPIGVNGLTLRRSIQSLAHVLRFISTKVLTEEGPLTSIGSEQDWDRALFVYIVWIVMLLQGLAQSLNFGSNVPWFDDWGYVRVVSNEDPITWAWLWGGSADELHTPLVRLVYALIVRTTGDFRSLLYFNSVALGLMALTLTWAAANLRGSISYTDAYFSIVLLRPQDVQGPFLWPMIVHFVLVSGLATVILLAVFSGGSG